MPYLIKVEEHQAYGGPEEGGWWYNHERPLWRFAIPVPTERIAYAICRWYNNREHDRREREELRDYTSVLSHECEYFALTFSDTFRPHVTPRPHYE